MYSKQEKCANTLLYHTTDVPPMLSLEGNEEEVRERKGLKILPPNKLLTRLPILLAQIKTGSNSNRSKNDIGQILDIWYQHNKFTKKSLQQFNQVVIIMKENMSVIRDPKTFYFYFDWPKDVDNNLKHEIEFIMKSNESLAENKIKKEIEQLMSSYKHRNNIHEHGKQQTE